MWSPGIYSGKSAQSWVIKCVYLGHLNHEFIVGANFEKKGKNKSYVGPTKAYVGDIKSYVGRNVSCKGYLLSPT